MNYTKLKFNNYDVHYINTKKFRDNYISIRFTMNASKDLIKHLNFIKELLTFSTKNYNEKQLTIESENLYNLIINTNLEIIGNNCVLSFNFRFLNKKFSNKNISEKVINLIKEILFNPNIKENEFVDFDKIKKQIIEEDMNLLENKEYISLKECIKKTDINNPIAFWFLDDIENTENIEVYNSYKKLIDSNVDVFVVGSINVDDYKKHCKDINFKNNKTYNSFKYEYINEKPENKIIEIKNDIFKQASLVLNYKSNQLSDFEMFYVMKIFSNIIGGGLDSKLFKNVREKYSLAYYCSSNLYSHNNIFSIRSGIDYIDKDKCISLIKKEFNAKITKTELDVSKKMVLSQINNTFNSFSSITNYYYGLKYHSSSIEEKIKNYKKITINDLNKVREKLVYSSMVVVYGN